MTINIYWTNYKLTGLIGFKDLILKSENFFSPLIFLAYLDDEV